MVSGGMYEGRTKNHYQHLDQPRKKRMKNEKLVNNVTIVILMPLDAWSLAKLSIGVEGYFVYCSTSLTMTNINLGNHE